MKTPVCLLLLLTALAARASDISDLASGYAAAFGCLDKATARIHYANAGQPEVLKGVKDVKAFGGALLIKFDNGDQIVLNAAAVQRMAE